MADNKHYMVVTDLGLSLIEDAYNAGTKVNLVAMALGDSNGAYVEPDSSFTSLVNEFGREDIHEGNSGEYLIDVISYVGVRHAGKTVREFGLYDDADNLIAYGAYPESLVPDVGSSEYIQLEIEARVDLANASAVTITVNPIYPYATEAEAGIIKIIKEAEVTETDESKADDSKALTLFKLLKRKATDKLAGITMLSHLVNGVSKSKAASEYALGLVNAVAANVPKVEELQEKLGWFTNERAYLGQTSLTHNNLKLSHYVQTKTSDATIERGYPTNEAGVLDVAHTAANRKTLTYITHGTKRLFVTYVTIDTPDAPAADWVEFYSTQKMPTSTEDEFGVIKIINEQEVIEPDESKADDSKALTLFKLLKRKATDKLAGVTFLSHLINGVSKEKATSEYATGELNKKKVNKSGDTMTGRLQIENEAVYAYLPVVTESNQLKSGLSVSSASNGTYETILNVVGNSPTSRAFQLKSDTTGRKFSMRTAHSNASDENGFHPWVELYHSLNAPTVEVLQKKAGWFTNERSYLGQAALTHNNLTLSHYTQTKTSDATIARGYPLQEAGVLDVAHTASSRKTLTYITYGTKRLFVTYVTIDTPDAPASGWVEFYSTQKKPTPTEIGALQWKKVANGSCSIALKNSTRETFMETIETGYRSNIVARENNSGRFRVVMLSKGAITSSDPNNCWWSYRGEAREITYWSTTEVFIDVYASGAKLNAGTGATGWELWELQAL